MTRALQIVGLEHFNIHSVLACLRYLVRAIEKGEWEPDFALLSAIVDYMEAFPEALHHPKEESHLFAALLRRRPEAAALIDRLCEDHAKGVPLLDDLRTALAEYRKDRRRSGASG
jgi:branched-chain amino acid transport system ATP-binding protein